MSATLTRNDENEPSSVPVNILVGSLFRRTGMFVGTSIFIGATQGQTIAPVIKRKLGFNPARDKRPLAG